MRKEDRYKSGRIGSYKRCFKWSFSQNLRYKHCSARIEFEDEDEISMTIAIPFIIYMSLGIKPGFQLPKEKEISISIHSGCIWWNLGFSEDRWKVPFLKGNFNPFDFFFGRPKYSDKEIESREIVIPMPEAGYKATAKLFIASWSRPRWFTKSIQRVSIEIPEGIPFPGKGENSYDCGPDATYSITTGECNSIPEGVGKLVASVLRDRVNYGGYGSWAYDKREKRSSEPVMAGQTEAVGNKSI